MSLTGKQVGELQALYESVYDKEQIKEDIILTEEEFEELCAHILVETFNSVTLNEGKGFLDIGKNILGKPEVRKKGLDLLKRIVLPKTVTGAATRYVGVDAAAGGKTSKKLGAIVNPSNVYGYVKGMSTAVDKNMQGAGQILKDKETKKYYTTNQARDLKNSFEFANFNLHIVEGADSLEDLTKELNKGKSNDNIENKDKKNKKTKLPSSIDFSKPSTLDIKPSGLLKDIGKPKDNNDNVKKDGDGTTNKVNTDKIDTKNEVDTKQNNVVKTGPDLDAIGKYSRNREVTMKDFQPSKPVIKPEVKTPEPEVKKMNPIEVKNRARFGDAHVDKLKAKNIDFKAMRKGDMTKDAFIKKYPKSITAQKEAGLRDEYEPYDLVLDYVLSEGHADTVEEAHYIMMQMDEESIKSILNIDENLGRAAATAAGVTGAVTLSTMGLDAIKNLRKNLKKMEGGEKFKKGSTLDNIQKRNEMLKNM